MKITTCLMSLLLLTLTCETFAVTAESKDASKKLTEKLNGTWILKGVTCNRVQQSLDSIDYTLSFHGDNGAYVSKLNGCEQVEPELYTYVAPDEVAIKSGIRSCKPNPCKADLEASQCGKETNPAKPVFKVEFKDHGKSMILSTSDPKSVDCIGSGQKKPAVFTFIKQSF